jgi:PAS domain S-box-containing protein
LTRLDYEALLAGLPDAVLGVDEGLRIVLWNPAAEALLGRSARRTLGRALKDVFPPDTSLIRHLGDTLATGESRAESEAVVEGVEGRPVYVSIVTAPLAGRSGAVTAAVAVVRDVTRLRQLEAEMRRGETLAAAGQIAMGLAHEIRNPLGAIRGAVQLLKRELGTRRAGASTSRCSSRRWTASTASSRCCWTWAGR